MVDQKSKSKTLPLSELLYLDHVSLAVGSLPDAIRVLDHQLGLYVTITPEDPSQHGRVFLDRSYVEVAVQAGNDLWSVPLFFLGFKNPDLLRTHLEDINLDFRWGQYVGADGTWDDVEIVAGEVPLPILVRRTSPSKIATDWPPALTQQHRCGAYKLAAVHLTVRDLVAAREVYTRLLGPGQKLIVLKEGGNVGVSGLVFSVKSHEEIHDMLGNDLCDPDKDGISWVTPEKTKGVRIGFFRQQPS